MRYLFTKSALIAMLAMAGAELTAIRASADNVPKMGTSSNGYTDEEVKGRTVGATHATSPDNSNGTRQASHPANRRPAVTTMSNDTMPTGNQAAPMSGVLDDRPSNSATSSGTNR